MTDNVIELTDTNSDPDRYVCENKGLIINPGALGDCILTIPLAEFMLKTLPISSVDFAGQPGYIDFFPGRTCISKVRPIDSMDFYRFFVDHDDFNIQEKDPLALAFSSYQWIVSFLGEKDSDFEKNLIFTVYSTHSADISILPLFAETGSNCHISEFYLKKFIDEHLLKTADFKFNINGKIIFPVEADAKWGQQLLSAAGIDRNQKTVIIHPGSGGEHKCWHIDNYCQVALLLLKGGFQPVFLLGPAECERFSRQQIQKLQAAGKVFSSLNIKQACQLISVCNAYMGNDSGISHLAAGMGAKAVVIFGPTESAVYRPVGPDVSILTANEDSFEISDDNYAKQVFETICFLMSD